MTLIPNDKIIKLHKNLSSGAHSLTVPSELKAEIAAGSYFQASLELNANSKRLIYELVLSPGAESTMIRAPELANNTPDEVADNAR